MNESQGGTPMTRDNLIDRVAQAIHAVAEGGAPWGDARMADKEQHRAEAAAALSVFEESLAPTGDDREALAAEREEISRIVGGHVDIPVSSRLAIARSLQGNGFRRSEVAGPSADDREEISDEALWDFAGDLLDAWNIEDTNAPSLAEDFRDRFVARFHAPYREIRRHDA